MLDNTYTKHKLAAVLLITIFLAACPSSEIRLIPAQGSEADADNLLIVDCLLPGRIKKLGVGVTFITPRRPAKLTAFDCENRGGEYVAYDQANSASALKVWLPAAEQGDAEAQTYVGEIYEKGFGIQSDYRMAVLWYQRAVGQDHARAKLNLGYLYEKGLGVEKNLALALSLYRSASGFDETEMEFAVVVDKRSVDTREDKEILALKNQLKGQQAKLNMQSKQLHDLQVALKQEQKQLSGERQAIRQQRSASTTNTKLSEKEQQRLDQRESQLDQRSQALTKREQKIQQDLDRILVLQQPPRIEPRKKNIVRRVAIAGPSIQLINPQLINMRGLPEISVRPGNKTREIVGSVNAPAGLQSFVVNDRVEKIDDKGIFKVLFSVEEKRNPVRIVAVDKLGKHSVLEFELVQGATKRPVPVAQVNVKDVSGNFGSFHALIIGNNGYTQFPKLTTAVNDAKSVAQVLSRKYGFKTTTLINANRFMILAALNRLSKKLTKKDNLLVYYAGHGELTKEKDVGYWLPVDAARRNKRKWIPNTAISDVINAMLVKRVLVIADSCYSGALTRSSLSRMDSNQVSTSERLIWLRTMAKSKARLALTSGGLKPVADVGDSNHSLFANALLSVLNANDGILEGQRLHNLLYAKVTLGAQAMGIDQTPEYAPIRYAGHESGEFFFLPRTPSG